MIPEKLVEKVAYILSPHAIVWRCDDESCEVCEPRRKEDRERAEIIITLILSAVRDGRLNIPGEVIREKLRGAEHPWGVGLKVGDILIALREERENG